MTAIAASIAARAQAVRAEPMGVVELRGGGGMSIGGGAGEASLKIAPVYAGAYVSVATIAQPWTWIRGGVFIETRDRSAVGAQVGPRIALGRWVTGASATAVIAPFTLYGASAQLARRFGKNTAIVPGLDFNVFPFGSDLPEGKVVSELLLTVGVEINAW